MLDENIAGETREGPPVEVVGEAPVEGPIVAQEVTAVETAAAEKRRTFARFPLGYVAFAIAVILVIAEAIAINLATTGQPVAATAIGQILVVLTALPIAVGLFVALRGPKREWGIAAMVVAIIANPLILLNVLSFFGTL